MFTGRRDFDPWACLKRVRLGPNGEGLPVNCWGVAGPFFQLKALLKGAIGYVR